MRAEPALDLAAHELHEHVLSARGELAVQREHRAEHGLLRRRGVEIRERRKQRAARGPLAERRVCVALFP